VQNVFRSAMRMARKCLGPAVILAAVAGTAQALPPPGPPDAPEIDPGSIGSALTLLTGGVFLLTGKSRKA
jgi:hypothetical protein